MQLSSQDLFRILFKDIKSSVSILNSEEIYQMLIWNEDSKEKSLKRMYLYLSTSGKIIFFQRIFKNKKKANIKIFGSSSSYTSIKSLYPLLKSIHISDKNKKLILFNLDYFE